MKVYVTGGSVYCSATCADNAGDHDFSRVSLPARPKNKVLDVLLGRATCDWCGTNFEDLAARG